MKKIENTKKTNVFKKIFIKICRIIGFEIIENYRLLLVIPLYYPALEEKDI